MSLFKNGLSKHVNLLTLGLLLGILFSFYIPIKANVFGLDPAFGVNGRTSAQINTESYGGPFEIQSDGKIVVLGNTWNGNNREIVIIRFNYNGTLDDTFGTGGFTTTNFNNVDVNFGGLAIQPNGKIVIVGGTVQFGVRNSILARYNSNGSLDSSFGNNGKLIIDLTIGFERLGRVQVRPDGRILVMGTLTNGRDFFLFAQFNSNGSLDPAFGQSGVSTIGISVDSAASKMILQQDGTVLFSGNIFLEGQKAVVAKLTENGNLDASFANNGFAVVKITNSIGVVSSDLKLQSDGKVVLGGYFYLQEGSDFFLARFNLNGQFDTSFGSQGISVADIEEDNYPVFDIQLDGKILLGGPLRFGGGNRFAVIRFSSNGSIDATFGLNGKIINQTARIADLKVQNDGKIIVSGDYFTGSSVYNVLIRYMNSVGPHFDFEGDNRTDVSIFRPSVGEWWYLRSSDNSNRAFQFGASTDKIVPADFTGDGKTDIAFWRESTGEWFILRSEDSSFYSFPFGTTGDVSISADYDGDGKDDPAIFRSSNATWYILNSGGGTRIQQFGASGDQPVRGDFDGDGKADLAIFRPSNGQWWINRSADQATQALSFGVTTDKPVPADFTGDGKTDVAFYRPNGEWFVLRSEDSSFYSFPFGQTGDVPVVGDYDGDGKADPAIFRNSNTTWYLLRSTTGFAAVSFGISGDTPVPSAYVP